MAEDKTDATPSLAVGLCTYKRPDGLRRVLEHVGVAAGRLGRTIQVVVVDNDGSDPAVAGIVSAFQLSSDLLSHYIVETRPGISAARNAVFDRMEQLKVRFVAMIDDDEWPSPDWLVELLQVQAAEDVAVVGGPVIPVFPQDRQTLQNIARYWSVLPQKLHGKVLVFCTCNFLIDMDALANRPRPLFDDNFGLSGGGDTVFFPSPVLRGPEDGLGGFSCGLRGSAVVACVPDLDAQAPLPNWQPCRAMGNPRAGARPPFRQDPRPHLPPPLLPAARAGAGVAPSRLAARDG